MKTKYDVIIVGGGHNGLVAACYLARAGKDVLILEKNPHLGGASVSQRLFPDFDARISRYAYLISLFPYRIVQELGLDLPLLPRPVASYTPNSAGGHGLLIRNDNSRWNESEVNRLGPQEWRGYKGLMQKQQVFAGLVWDSLMEPLKPRSAWEKDFQAAGESQLWTDFVERPLGELLERELSSDLLRGIILTDGKIGSYPGAHDASLLQNRTFVYHIIGRGDGQWRVPEGGMGHLTSQLAFRAGEAGATWQLGARVTRTDVNDKKVDVVFEHAGSEMHVEGSHLIWNAPPPSCHQKAPSAIDEGTSFKINMLLERLPQPAETRISPEEAFSGTFHIDESYRQLAAARDQVARGELSERPPGEVYCHTLTDPSILSTELQQRGYHTLTWFGIDLPYALFEKDNETAKKIVVDKVLAGLDRYLATPLETCLARSGDGTPCLEAKSPVDLETELGLPRGNIFHNGLSWFFAETTDEVGTYGVETSRPNEWVCGSSAKRGGAVSGIPGRNAAIALLRAEGLSP